MSNKGRPESSAFSSMTEIIQIWHFRKIAIVNFSEFPAHFFNAFTCPSKCNADPSNQCPISQIRANCPHAKREKFKWQTTGRLYKKVASSFEEVSVTLTRPAPGGVGSTRKCEEDEEEAFESSEATAESSIVVGGDIEHSVSTQGEAEDDDSDADDEDASEMQQQQQQCRKFLRNLTAKALTVYLAIVSSSQHKNIHIL